MDASALGLILVLHEVGLMCEIVACPGHTHMLYTACADPERFARGGPTLTTFFLYFMRGERIQIPVKAGHHRPAS